MCTSGGKFANYAGAGMSLKNSLAETSGLTFQQVQK